MLVCGIETSCDETGLALWNDSGLVAQVLHSQVQKHRVHGGVVPEIAARDHLQSCPHLWSELIKKSGINAEEIDYIAYTAGPGLVGCLLTGESFARGLSIGLGRPCIPINHLEGHLMSMVIGADDWYQQLLQSVPFLGCLVSGGHCMILDIKQWGHYEVLGTTRDDAVGEAFDKVAKLMGLSYPGGPEISRLAKKGRPIYDFPRPMMHSKDLDMSFSGLKTAVRNIWLASEKTEQVVMDIASSFEHAVADVLVHKIKKAIKLTGRDHVVLSGGVSANDCIRAKMDGLSQELGIKVTYPDLSYCTDNGAMIALTGWIRAHYNCAIKGTFVRARWPLKDVDIIDG